MMRSLLSFCFDVECVQMQCMTGALTLCNFVCTGMPLKPTLSFGCGREGLVTPGGSDLQAVVNRNADKLRALENMSAGNTGSTEALDQFLSTFAAQSSQVGLSQLTTDTLSSQPHTGCGSVPAITTDGHTHGPCVQPPTHTHCISTDAISIAACAAVITPHTAQAAKCEWLRHTNEPPDDPAGPQQAPQVQQQHRRPPQADWSPCRWCWGGAPQQLQAPA